MYFFLFRRGDNGHGGDELMVELDGLSGPTLMIL